MFATTDPCAALPCQPISTSLDCSISKFVRVSQKVIVAISHDAKAKRLLRCGISADLMTARGHMWTAPDCQELFDADAALVGCGHVSGLLMRHGRPLALMLCADQVPIQSTHSKMR
jgi:hypothetical protein